MATTTMPGLFSFKVIFDQTAVLFSDLFNDRHMHMSFEEVSRFHLNGILSEHDYDPFPLLVMLHVLYCITGLSFRLKQYADSYLHML